MASARPLGVCTGAPYCRRQRGVGREAAPFAAQHHDVAARAGRSTSERSSSTRSSSRSRPATSKKLRADAHPRRVELDAFGQLRLDLVERRERACAGAPAPAARRCRGRGRRWPPPAPRAARCSRSPACGTGSSVDLGRQPLQGGGVDAEPGQLGQRVRRQRRCRRRRRPSATRRRASPAAMRVGGVGGQAGQLRTGAAAPPARAGTTLPSPSTRLRRL